MPFYYKSHGKPAPNKFVATVRRIYNPLGFQRGYNFPLWIIFGLGTLAFCASRAMYLNYNDIYLEDKRITADAESQSHGRWRVGMLMHLASVVPIGFLLPFQFLPIIRYKLMIWHRLAGYLLILLLLAGNVGACLAVDRAMGGSLELRAFTYVTAGLTTVSMLLAYINIKRLQIDQHRAWMLRGWVYAFLIVAARIIQIPTMDIVSWMGVFYVPMKCHSIDYILEQIQPGLASVFYPECANSPDYTVSVLANIHAEANEQGIPRLHEIGAAVQITLPFATIFALFLHVFGVELYLHLTSYEARRLKHVSRERQLARGWSRPGDASWLTREAWGDVGDDDVFEERNVLVDQEKNKEVSPPRSGSDGSGVL